MQRLRQEPKIIAEASTTVGMLWSAASNIDYIPIWPVSGYWPKLYDLSRWYQFYRIIDLEYSIVSSGSTSNTNNQFAHCFVPYNQGVTQITTYAQLSLLQQARSFSSSLTTEYHTFVPKPLLHSLPVKWWSTSASATTYPSVVGNIYVVPYGSVTMQLTILVKMRFELKSGTINSLSIGPYIHSNARVDDGEEEQELRQVEEKHTSPRTSDDCIQALLQLNMLRKKLAELEEVLVD